MLFLIKFYRNNIDLNTWPQLRTLNRTQFRSIVYQKL